MKISHPVNIPLLNPNEPEAKLVKLHVHEGQHVREGDQICTLETTKSTSDQFAEISGFIAGLTIKEGQTVHAGNILCYIANSPDWQPMLDDSGIQQEFDQDTIPDGLRITQPALNLAKKNNFDLNLLPIGPLITENSIKDMINSSSLSKITIPDSEFNSNAIIVYGGGGHGKSLIDLLKSLQTYDIVGIIDDGIPLGELILGVPVIGGAEILPDILSKGIRLAVNAVGGIGNINVRIQVFHQLAQTGFGFPILIHPTAYVESSALLSPGVQIFPHAYVGSEVKIGYGSIINTGVIVSHDCIIGDFVNISPGAILAGQVQIGDGVLIGMGVTINLQAKIGIGARIGNNATIKSDVPNQGVVQAGKVWPD
jgi:sugar O-acyltransferase (sialic acid O-acetyltransferase NeuD family)